MKAIQTSLLLLLNLVACTCLCNSMAFQRRFGPDSALYNTPLYFRSENCHECGKYFRKKARKKLWKKSMAQDVCTCER